MDRDRVCVLLLVLLFAILIMTGCTPTWKSPADPEITPWYMDREDYSIQHIHGPDCIHKRVNG